MNEELNPKLNADILEIRAWARRLETIQDDDLRKVAINVYK